MGFKKIGKETKEGIGMSGVFNLSKEAKRLRQRAEKLYKEVKQLRKEVMKIEKLRKEAVERNKELEMKVQELQEHFPLFHFKGEE